MSAKQPRDNLRVLERHENGQRVRRSARHQQSVGCILLVFATMVVVAALLALLVAEASDAAGGLGILILFVGGGCALAGALFVMIGTARLKFGRRHRQQ